MVPAVQVALPVLLAVMDLLVVVGPVDTAPVGQVDHPAVLVAMGPVGHPVVAVILAAPVHLVRREWAALVAMVVREAPVQRAVLAVMVPVVVPERLA